MTVAIIIPVLARPHRARPALESALAATPDARVLFVCDPGDHEEREAVFAAGGDALLVDGGYARKVNVACRVTAEPFVFAAADDLHFRQGWFDRARAAIRGQVQVVGVNDMMRRRRRQHATHFLMTREYVGLSTLDGGAGPMCEAYAHSFVDDELIATAKHRGVYAYEPAAVVEHQHWMNRRAPDDETYRKGRVDFDADRALFEQRSRLWT